MCKWFKEFKLRRWGGEWQLCVRNAHLAACASVADTCANMAELQLENFMDQILARINSYTQSLQSIQDKSWTFERDSNPDRQNVVWQFSGL